MSRMLPDFLRRRVENAIEEAKHPKGMSVHDGTARIHGSDLQHLLTMATLLEKLLAEPEEVEWVVNDLGELGVKIGERLCFLYKGDSLEYSGLHDDGTPMLWRPVGKREFGEVCYPYAIVKSGIAPHRYTEELKYIPGLSFGEPGDGAWRPLPVKEKE